MFAPDMWKMHDATMNNDPRTNNLCEGWNNMFFNLVGYYYPSTWQVIEWFQQEQATVSTVIQQDAIDNSSQRHVGRRYVQLQERLHNLCLDRIEGHKTVAEFLRGIGRNIRISHQR